MTRFIVTENYDQMSEKAALLILRQINKKDNSLLGLATGSTPVGTYENLIKWNQQGLVDFAAVKTVSLDEYMGVDENDEQSYRWFMNDNFFNKVNIKIENTHIPMGKSGDIELECRNYEDRINLLGGIDLQLLGIGENGHIGFNEPTSFFEKHTHVVALNDSTRKANARFFESVDKVPTHAITMGIGVIMAARRIVLVVNGSHKAQALYKSFFENVDPMFQASILQYHQDVTVVADQEAMQVINDKKVVYNDFISL